MNEIEKILETLEKNQEIAQKFFEIEISVLSILNFNDFLERLLTEIQQKRNIPFVWLTLIEGTDASDMIQQAASSSILQERTNIVNRGTFLSLINNSTAPVLANSNLKSFQPLIPGRYINCIRSLAVVPLTLDGEIIGSINHGDYSPDRYNPDMGTILLRQLATIISICLSNVLAHEKLNILASKDPLTQLINRRVLEQILKREFERAVRYQTPLTAMFIDVDDFKLVNDQFGHKAGDNVLKYIADNLLRMTRGSDVVARFAGDEFIIVLPNTPINKAAEMTFRLKSFFMNNPLVFENTPIRVSISLGLASLEKGINDSGDLLKRADAMLYRAKKHKGTQKDPASN